MSKDLPKFFHLHLISDATGETLGAMVKAAIVQYAQIRSIEHVHSLVRNKRQMNRVLQEIETAPGIVLYTIVNPGLAALLEDHCKSLNVPCIPVLASIMKVFESYLGAPATPTVGGQHVLDAEYFRRIDALNFTMAHDDGRLPEDLNDAHIVIVGISRTSKTPTSIYLAQRGFKTTNVPLILSLPLPPQLEKASGVFVVGLIASADRIAQVRRNRALALADRELSEYVDRGLIEDELTFTRRLCSRNGWPVIDVTRRSVEETAAAILKQYHNQPARAAATEG